MSESELKPCPFCGGEPKLVLDDTDDYIQHWYWVISCADCICMEGDNKSEEAKHELIKRWNTRAAKQTSGVVIKASKFLDDDEDDREEPASDGSVRVPGCVDVDEYLGGSVSR